MAITHAFVSTVADDPNEDLVRPSNWNADHTIERGTIVRTATLVVAASDASTKSKAEADYICDGTSDEVQIEAALDALTTGGTVLLSEGAFSVADLTIDEGTVKGQGSVLTNGTTINVTGSITVTEYGRLHGVRVVAPSSYTGNAVIVQGSSIGDMVSLVLDDVYIKCSTQTGTGLLIRATSTTAHNSVSLSSFGSIAIFKFEYGMKLYATESDSHDGFVNGNIFESVLIANSVYMLTINGVSTAACMGNIFNAIQLQPMAGTVDGIHLSGVSSYNKFNSVQAWDWTLASGKILIIDSGITGTYAVGEFMDWYTDNGTYSKLIMTGAPASFQADAFQYPAPGTDWTPALEGAVLAANKSAKKVWIPLPFFGVRDILVSYILVGDMHEEGGDTCTLDCKLVRITKADPLTTTDVANGAITQITADGDFAGQPSSSPNFSLTVSNEFIALEISGTTSNVSGNEFIKIAGARVIVAARF